ncbi:MAG: cysteine desulfurase [Acidobacteria bacterium]|nr:cysteine desulfurase [Acidobacteriota bacterium]
MIYLDNNATTPLLVEVAEAMRPYLDREFGNPGGIYDIGNRAKVAVEKARSIVAKALGAMPSEITFAGSGTEADNHALVGAALMAPPERKKVVVSAIEHSAVVKPAGFLARFGFEVARAPIHYDTNGAIDPQPILDLIDKRTALVSLMHTNNETGVVLPVRPVFARAAEVGAISHCDAVQSFGKIDVDPGLLGCDTLTISAHKFHGPKGVACLYTRKGVRLEPLIHGGSQENQRRAGTENVMGIVGMGAAVAAINLAEMSRVKTLRDTFENMLCDEMGDRVEIQFSHLERVPNTSSVRFVGQNANIMLIKLDRHEVCASTGAACHSGALSVSPVLLAMGLGEDAASQTVRFSLSKLTTRSDVEGAIAAIKKILG